MTRRRSSEDVTLNVAAMLDMAFQLLTFFILTFKPPPPEAHISLELPPPQPVVGGGQMKAGSNENIDPKEVKPVKTLTISVGSESGGIDAMAIGVPTVRMEEVKFPQLGPKLSEWLKGSGGAFEQVIIETTPNLRYGDLMSVVEVCSQQTYADGTKLTKLSFVTPDIPTETK